MFKSSFLVLGIQKLSFCLGQGRFPQQQFWSDMKLNCDTYISSGGFTNSSDL